MTYEELKKDKRFLKLMTLVPELWVSDSHICVAHFNMAGSDNWFSHSSSYSSYKDFDFRGFALTIVKYSRYSRMK